MSIGVRDADQSEQNHGARREHRGGAGGHVREERQPGVVGVQFLLEFGVSIIVQPYADHSRQDEQHHQ